MATQEITINPSVPTGLSEIQGWGQAFFASGMFTDIKSAAQAVVKIQAGKELGLQPIFSLQNLHVINNKISVSANAMAFLVKRSGRYDYEVTKSTDTDCTVVFYEYRNGERVKIGDSSFTLDDAKRAGLTGNPTWGKYPKNMCFSRAISNGARMYCPDAIGGVYTEEEMEAVVSDSKPRKASPVVTTVDVIDADTGEVVDAPQSESDKDWDALGEAKEETPEPAPVTSTPESTKYGCVDKERLDADVKALKYHWPTPKMHAWIKDRFGYSESTFLKQVSKLTQLEANTFMMEVANYKQMAGIK